MIYIALRALGIMFVLVVIVYMFVGLMGGQSDVGYAPGADIGADTSALNSGGGYDTINTYEGGDSFTTSNYDYSASADIQVDSGLNGGDYQY